jgi:hypothetical protein
MPKNMTKVCEWAEKGVKRSEDKGVLGEGGWVTLGLVLADGFEDEVEGEGEEHPEEHAEGL